MAAVRDRYANVGETSLFLFNKKPAYLLNEFNHYLLSFLFPLYFCAETSRESKGETLSLNILIQLSMWEI